MQIIVDGLLINYVRLGQGPLVLILPGWADTSVSWMDAAKTLSADYDVIVLDLPGFGGSQQPDAAWGVDEYAEFVGRFLSKLTGDNKVFALVGHSNGGAMSIRSLSQGYIGAEKLVLVASAGIRNQQPGRKKVLKLVAKTGKLITAPLPAATRKHLRSKLYASAGSDLLVAEHMQESFKKVVSDDVQQDAMKLKLPVLLLYGDKDTDTPVRYGETFNSIIDGSRLEVINGAGHFLHLEKTDEVVKQIKEFLG